MVAVLDKNCRRLVAQGCFSGGGGGGGADALVTGRGGVSWRRRGVVAALLVKRDVNNGFGIMAISTAAAASFPTPSMALCLYLSDYAALSLSLSLIQRLPIKTATRAISAFWLSDPIG